MSKSEYITSTSNAKYKTWLSLLQSKGIKAEEKYLVSGRAVVEQILNTKEQDIDALLLTETHKELERLDVKTFVLSNDLFKEIDIFGTKFPIAVLKTPKIKAFDFIKTAGITAFIPVGDPSNLGAILRSCNAFSVKNIVLLKEAASPFHPKSVRSASGNLFTLNFFDGPSIHELKEKAHEFYALDVGGKDLSTFQIPASLWLLVGEEGPGIPDYGFQKLSIPISKDCESLNASVALGIALYALTSK
jgi:TrmH family RNA methyltransferase